MTLDEARMIAVVAKTELGKAAEALNTLLDHVQKMERSKSIDRGPRGSAGCVHEATRWIMYGKAEGLRQFAQELRNRCSLRYCLEADLADTKAAEIDAQMKQEALHG